MNPFDRVSLNFVKYYESSIIELEAFKANIKVFNSY